MAHGLNVVIKSEFECNNQSKQNTTMENQPNQYQAPQRPAGTKMGSRRIFTPQFKLQVLESYRNDSDCKGNQRATARKYGIHRRQIQKWLQVENNLRTAVANSSANHHPHYHHPIISHNSSNNTNKNHLINNNFHSEAIMKMPSDAVTRHRVVVGNRGNHTNNNNNNVVYTTKFKASNTYTTTAMNSSNFISPILSYGHDQPAISFTHHRNIAAATPTYEYESSSAGLSSLTSSPISSTINNTINISPVHLHPYPQASYISPTPLHPIYNGTIIKPEPHHIVPSPNSHMIPPTPYITESHYYPAIPTPVSSYYPPQESPEQIPVKYLNNNDYTPLPESPIDLSLPHQEKQHLENNNKSRTSSPSSNSHGKWVNVLDSDIKVKIKQEFDAVDLTLNHTCKKRKHDDDEEINEGHARPVKLFKPYLLDEEKDIDKNDVGFKKNLKSLDDDTDSHRQKDAIIWNNHSTFSTYDTYHHRIDTSPQSSVYSSPPYPLSPYEVPSQCTYFLPPQSSPVSGYESSSSSIYGDSNEPAIYSIDFKVQSLNCEYSNDLDMCHRNSHLIHV